MRRIASSEPRSLLLYYFGQAGVDTSGDRGAEILSVVDAVVEEAAEQARRDIISDIFCAACGAPRTYEPGSGLLLDSCDCDEREPQEATW